MKIINLLPQDAQRKVTLEFVFNRVLTFWILVIVSLLVFLAMAFAAKVYLQRINSQTDTLITENEAILNSADFKGLQDEILTLTGDIKEINNLRSHHYYWSKALIALADLTPTSVQLNQATLDRETGRVDIAGQALTREDVIELWSRIIKSEHFKGINFPLANLERATIANFTFTFYLKVDKVMTP